MGFRSTFTTQEYDGAWPLWFRDKYAGELLFLPEPAPLQPVREAKTYDNWEDLPSDIQKSIVWKLHGDKFILVYLHECGGITRVQIQEDKILYSEPDRWKVTDGVTHSYCQGCSDVTEKQIEITGTDQNGDRVTEIMHGEINAPR